MTQDPEKTTKKPRHKRRWWPRWLNRRVVLALLLLLCLAGWRYGWPPRSWETTVCPLEEIGWLEAARLTPDCLNPYHLSGARSVLLAEGALDPSGTPVFDVEQPWLIEPAVIPLCQEILPGLTLPSLVGKRFYAGVFWVDMPVEHEGKPADALDPAVAHSVLLMGDPAEPWEQAATLIVDLNRNRDLTDDPVMPLSDVWSDEDEFTGADINWFSRVFDPLELSRTAAGPGDAEADVDVVRALPALTVIYHQGGKVLDSLSLAFYPTSFRRGRLVDGRRMKEVVIAPDRTRFGRFDGPLSAFYPVDGPWTARRYDIRWVYERGTFWGCTLDAEGRELRDGPYQGPTGILRVETADGQPLRIGKSWFWLHGKDLRQLYSPGWTPVPRFSWLARPMDELPLPVGEYGIQQIVLSRGGTCFVTVRSMGISLKPSPREFSIQNGETMCWHLPGKLEVKAIAGLDVSPRPYHVERIWSTEDDVIDEPGAVWTGPQPGCKVTLDVLMTDPVSGNRFTINNGGARDGAIRVVIQDEAGKIVHEGAMEYG